MLFQGGKLLNQSNNRYLCLVQLIEGLVLEVLRRFLVKPQISGRRSGESRGVRRAEAGSQGVAAL